VGASGTRSRHKGSRSRSEALRASAAVLTTGTVIGYSLLLGIGDDRPGHRSGAGTLDRVSSGVAQDTDGRRHSSVVGVILEGARSDTTLLQVRKVKAPKDRAAPAGQEWYGIRARTCRHAGAGDRDRSPWSDWEIVTSDGTTYPARRVSWTDFPPQQFPTDGIAAGRCAVGWVLVAVPRGTYRNVVAVRYRSYSPAGLEWEV
jgi:hypothetical protein